MSNRRKHRKLFIARIIVGLGCIIYSYDSDVVTFYIWN